MASTVSSFLSSKGLSRSKAHAYPQVISRSFRDEEDRSFRVVEANLSILRQRIELIGSKEKLERCYKFQQGWNYISEYNNDRHKRDNKLLLEWYEVVGLVGCNLGLVFLSGCFCIFLVSFLAHIHA